MKKTVPILISVIIGLWAVEAVADELPQYTCYQTADPIHVDGVLDEPGWSAVKKMGLSDVQNGGRPVWRTDAMILWDPTYLYVAFVARDPDVWATMTERDAHLWKEEVVELFLDPDGDGKNYVEWEFNCLNTVLDILMSAAYTAGGSADFGWDSEHMLSAVHVDGAVGDRDDQDIGFTVEIAIPWADLIGISDVPIPPNDRDRWRMNFYRYESSSDEYTAWSPTGKINFHVPEKFGVVLFSEAVVRPGPIFSFDDLFVDDDALGKSQGDGDGLMAAGEDIEIWVQVTNVGHAVAQGAMAMLSTEDPAVILLNPTLPLRDVPPQGKGMGRFLLRVAYDATPHLVDFTVEIMDQAGGYWLDTFQELVVAPFRVDRMDYPILNIPVAISTGDFDGDGDDDLVTCSRAGDNVSLFLNDGEGTFVEGAAYSVGSFMTDPAALFVGDLDGDGDVDIATANNVGSTASVLLNRGDATFEDPVAYKVGRSPSAVWGADLDGDDDMDLAVTDSKGLSILTNDGTGHFGEAQELPSSTSADVHAADVDLDGDIDLIYTGVGSLSILLNQGDGTFTEGLSLDTGTGQTFLCVSDLDGDGDEDLAAATTELVGSYGSKKEVGHLSIFLNHGDGTFFGAQTYEASPASDVFAADLDRDGDMDLVLSNGSGASISVVLNNGDGTFADAGMSSDTGDGPVSVCGRDFNGDGRTDVATANQSGSITVLFPIARPPVVTGVEEMDGDRALTPTGFVLYPNAPNPFNAVTRIRYDVPEVGHVSLKIYNLLGQVVRVLFDDERTPGRYLVLWDGRDDVGRAVASGVYFVRMEAGTLTKVRRMLFVR